MPNSLIDIDLAAANDKRLPHQIRAWQYLNKATPDSVKEQFGKLYRETEPPSATPKPLPESICLPNFPFFAQTDNGFEGWRQCQTSSISMALRYKKVKGILDDLDYLKIVNKYGDTTVQQSHVLALKALGVTAQFSQNLSVAQVKAELQKGNPVITGVLHHGNVRNPGGGGHYVAIYGYTKTAWMVNDPYGELDLVNGGWTRQGGGSGKGQLYGFKNFNPRWEALLVDGVYVYRPGNGWGWTFP